MYQVKQRISFNLNRFPFLVLSLASSSSPESGELFWVLRNIFLAAFWSRLFSLFRSLQHFNSFLPLPGQFVPTSIKTTVTQKPEGFLLERKLSHFLVRSGTIQQVIRQGRTMLLWKVVFAHAQPAGTGVWEHAPSLARNFLTHSSQANVP